MELFRPYVSLFKDPGMDEATTQLVDKYYKNMEYSDTLGQKLNELQNAPFSGDAAINKELKSLVNSGLEGLAAEGRYEHSEKELRKLATRFNTIAPGIMQNNTLYAKANQDLKERLEKKEINAQQYELARAYNTYGYEGLKLDTTGRVDQNTYFSAKTIYNDPKPIDMLSARLKDLLPRTVDKEQTTVGQNADGKWTYTVGGKTMQFNDADVTAIVNSIKKDDNVSRFIDQMGEMVGINSLAGGSTADALNTMAAGYKDYVAQLQTQKGSVTNPEEIKQYDELIASTSQRMTELQEVITSGDPNAMAQAIKQEYVQEKYNEIDSYGNTQRGLQTYTSITKRDQDYSKATARYEAMLNMPMTTSSMGEITAATDGTGVTYNEKVTNLQAAKARSEEYAKLAADTSLSDELRSTYQNMQRAQDIQIQKIEGTLKEAANAVINIADLQKQDPTLVEAVMKANPGKSPGEIYTIITAKPEETKAAFESTWGQGSYQKHIDQYYTSVVASGYTELSDQGEKTITNPAAVFSFSFGEKVTDAFKEIKTSPQFTNKIAMPTQEQTIQATNGVNEFFQTMKGQTGRPLKDTEEFIVDGKVTYGKDLPGYNIVKWEWSPDADMFQLILKGTGDNAEETKTVYMKGEQVIQTEGKDKALNAPVQRFATEVNNTGFGLKEGQSRTITGLWSFPYDRNSAESKPVDYKVTMKGGVEVITFYPSGSYQPISLYRQGQTEYKLDDPILEQMFKTNDFVPTPQKRTR
jgi:hypothetical protein